MVKLQEKNVYLISTRECILSCILSFLRISTGISLVAGKLSWWSGSGGQGQSAFAQLCIPRNLAAYHGRELHTWLLAFCASSLVQREQAMAEIFPPCEIGHQVG